MWLRLLFCLYAMTIGADRIVNAGIIVDGQISGNQVGGTSYSATGSDHRTLTSNNGYVTSTHTGIVTTDGLKSRLESAGSSFFSVSTGVIDVYTVTGGTPGETISLNAILNLEGDVSIAAGDFGSGVNVRGAIGLGLNNAAATSGNPVIKNGFFGRVNTERYFNSKGTTTPFDFDIVAELEVQSGTAFQMSFATRIFQTKWATTNMMDTASVRFELADGYTISSVENFGTAFDGNAVPEPSSFLIMALGAVSCVGFRRRTRK